MTWIISYVAPTLAIYTTRKYAGTYELLYTHFLLAISILLSWFFLDSISWNLSLIQTIILLVLAIGSWAVLQTPTYVISAIIQQTCILLAATLAPLWGLPIIVTIFSVLHPTWKMKIATLFLGSLSIFLYFWLNTIFYSFVLHIICITALFYFRKRVAYS